MKYVGYYNGEIGPMEEIKIPMLDRAVFFGDGCYDAAMYENNRIFALEEHLDRFYRGCQLLEIKFHLTREELKKELQKCIDANELSQGMIYWHCSRGTGIRAHNFPSEHVKPNLLMFTMPDEIVPMERTFKVISMEDTRFLHCNIKTLNLIPSVIAYQRCVEAECDETVLHRNGRVTECAHSNVLMLKEGVLYTPPRDHLILPGITLKHLLMLAEELKIPTKEEPFTLDELKNADEIIISNSGAFCMQVTEFDGIKVGGKDPVRLKALQDAYMDYYHKMIYSVES